MAEMAFTITSLWRLTSSVTWLVSCRFAGDSGGRTSTRMLRESVFLERDVGAAASRTLRRAIMYCGRFGRRMQ